MRPRPGRPVLGILKQRSVTFLMVLCTGLLLLGSVIVTAVLNAVSHFFPPESLPGG